MSLTLAARAVTSAILLIAFLVVTATRPPGTMLSVDGETLTYVLCAGDEIKSITMPLDDGHEIELGCDVLAGQITALTPRDDGFTLHRHAAHTIASTGETQTSPALHFLPTNKTRGPPLVS